MKRLILFLLVAMLLLTSMTGCLLDKPQNNETTPGQGTPFGTTPSLPEDQTTPPEETTPDGTTEDITTPTTPPEVTRPQVEPHTHIEVIDPTVEPTCTTDGKTEGKHCSICGEVLVAQKEITSSGYHILDNNNKCDSCGFESTCQFVWSRSSIGHYKRALCDCCTYSYQRMEHVDNDGDYFCDICGYEEPRPYYLAEKETWLNEINVEDIVEIYGTQSGIGTKTYGLKRFITITDKAQIAEILETARTIHITPFPSNTAGYEPTDESRYIQFTLADGTVYYIRQTGCEIYAQSPSSSLNVYEGMKLENIPLLDEYENDSVFYKIISVKAYDGIVYFDLPDTKTVYDAIGQIDIEKMDFTIELNSDPPDVTTGAFVIKHRGNFEILSSTTFFYNGILCILKENKTFYDIVDTSGVDQLIAAHEAKYNDGRKATVSTYYGEFSSGALVGMIVDDKTTYQEYEWADEAYDGRIKYTDSNRIVVLYNGKFYTLREAYKQHIIGDNDLHLIREMHDSRP